MTDTELTEEFKRLVALASDEEKATAKDFIISHGAQSNSVNSLQLPAFCP